MLIEAPMKHICGPFYFASASRFLYPGLYFSSRKWNGRIVPIPKAPEPPAIIEFPEQTVVIAKDQPEYRPLPAHVFKGDSQGRIACCWKFSFRDRLRILVTGKVWHEILTFNQPLQPQLLRVDKPEMTK